MDGKGRTSFEEVQDQPSWVQLDLEETPVEASCHWKDLSRRGLRDLMLDDRGAYQDWVVEGSREVLGKMD